MIWLLKEDKVVERDIELNEEVRAMAAAKGYQVFDDKWDCDMALSEYKQKNNIYNVSDILEQFGVSTVPVLKDTDSTTPIIKSKRGGKRAGAGAKKGVLKDPAHKAKIAQAMLGKQNALKS